MSIETIETIIEQNDPEKRVIVASTKTNFMELKKEVVESRVLEQKRDGFAQYLRVGGINSQEFPRASGIGKFLRTFRYYKEIKTISKEMGIPLNYFFALKMIEGEGDPTNINTSDGGAGISQIQPDTFKWFSKNHMKKDYKVFSDNPKYKKYDYDYLMKKYKDRAKVNGIIADKLLAIKEEYNYNLDKLMSLDDRFNPEIALDFSAEYLLYCKKKVKTAALTDKSWDKYKNDPKFDFEWMLAFNGYNKGPNNFDKKFTGSHITNLKTRIEQYDIYSKRLSDLLLAGYSYEQIIPLLKQKEATTSANGYDPSSKNTDQLRYLNESKDKQRYVYKYTMPVQNSAAELQKIYRSFDKKNIQITDGDGNKLTRGTLPTAVGQSFFIKEKKLR